MRGTKKKKSHCRTQMVTKKNDRNSRVKHQKKKERGGGTEKNKYVGKHVINR